RNIKDRHPQRAPDRAASVPDRRLARARCARAARRDARNSRAQEKHLPLGVVAGADCALRGGGSGRRGYRAPFVITANRAPHERQASPLHAAPAKPRDLQETAAPENPPLLASFSWTRIRQLGFSVFDQGASVGGMFLANNALARTQSREEYGVFALTYSVFTFLSGLHNAAVLEAYTIYGSGRYHRHFPSYARLLWRANAWLCFGLTAAVALVWGGLSLFATRYASRTLLGLALGCGILLTASFLRRTFYMQRR